MPDRELPPDDGLTPRNPSAPLPPELDPRGRRAARADARRRADAAQSVAALRTPPGTSGPRRAQRRRSSRRKVFFGATVGVRIIAAALSITILGYSYFYWHSYRKAVAQVITAAPLPKPSAGKVDIDGKAQNILLLGNDSRTGATAAELQALNTGDDGGSANTDTMMVMHIPADGSKATVISFPRDSYVAIPGHGNDRINAAYPDAYNAAKNSGASDTAAAGAGVGLLAQTIENLTGLQIDHYVEISLLGFYRISNALDGVPVLLCQAQKDSYSGINLPAGLSTIQGTQALAFVRQRHGLAGGDLDRIKRQQYFLSAVFSQLTNAGTLLNVSKVNKLLSAVGSSLITDGVDLFSLAGDFADMSSGNLTFATIPIDGNITVNGAAVLKVTPSTVQAAIAKDLGVATDPKLAGAATVAPGSVNVDVQNGTGQNGAATRASTALQALGFIAAADQSYNGSAVTTEIEYPDGMQGQAKTLLAKVPGATPVLDSSVSKVTLLLGSDGIGVTGQAGTTTSTAATPTAAATAVKPATGGVAGVANQPGCIN